MLRRVTSLAILAIGLWSTTAGAAIPERLKWVRGTVAAVSSRDLVIQLRTKTLRVAIDGATEAVPALAELKPGATVEVHYRDSRPTGTARYIWVAIALDPKAISKRPGTSAAGTIADLRPAHWLAPPRLTLISGKDRARFRVPSGTTAIERDDRVVVVYRRHRSRLTAQLIRVIPPRF